MRIQANPLLPDPGASAAARAIGLDPAAIVAGTLVYDDDSGRARLRYEAVRDLTAEEAAAFKAAWLGG